MSRRRERPPTPPPRPKALEDAPAAANGRKSRSKSRRKSRSKSMSKSRSKSLTLGVRMPHNQVYSGERIEAEVIERPAIRSGEPVWQAEIIMSQGTTNHSGRTRVFNIRGPPRKTREIAEGDAKQLTDVSTEGPKAVRALANQLHRA